MAAKKTISGNYFSVSVQRLVPGTDLDDRVSATDGSIEGESFTAGMIHNSEGSPEFIAYAGGKAIYEGAELTRPAKRRSRHVEKQSFSARMRPMN
jgi:hypothetical protein